MSTIKRSKRKCKSIYASSAVPTGNQGNNVSKVLKPSQHSRICLKDISSDVLLELCFQRMNAHTWYRILPFDHQNCDDIAFAIGQSWDLICPLLVDMGYLYEVNNEIRINLLKFENLLHLDIGNKKINMSYHHQKNESRQYFLCVGDPLLSGPTKQIDE